MENEENVHKEVYVVFDLNENMYIKYLNLYEDNALTLKAFLAQEFSTELDAITECKEYDLECFRVDKIYVLEYLLLVNSFPQFKQVQILPLSLPKVSQGFISLLLGKSIPRFFETFFILLPLHPYLLPISS